MFAFISRYDGMAETARIFGVNLSKILKARNQSQAWLAGKLGVSMQTVSSWKTGKSLPTGEMIDRIGHELQAPISAFFSEDNPKIPAFDKRQDEIPLDQAIIRVIEATGMIAPKKIRRPGDL